MDADDVGAVRERVWTAPRCKPFVPARQMNADDVKCRGGFETRPL